MVFISIFHFSFLFFFFLIFGKVSKDFSNFIIETDSLWTNYENKKPRKTPEAISLFPPDLLSLRKKFSEKRGDQFYLFFGIDLLSHFIFAFSVHVLCFLQAMYFQTLFYHFEHNSRDFYYRFDNSSPDSFFEFDSNLITIETSILFLFYFMFSMNAGAFRGDIQIVGSLFCFVLSFFKMSYYDILLFFLFNFIFIPFSKNIVSGYGYNLETPEQAARYQPKFDFKSIVPGFICYAIACRFLIEYPIFSTFIFHFCLFILYPNGILKVFHETKENLTKKQFFLHFIKYLGFSFVLNFFDEKPFFQMFFYSLIATYSENAFLHAWIQYFSLSKFFFKYEKFGEEENNFWISHLFFNLFFYFSSLKLVYSIILCLPYYIF